MPAQHASPFSGSMTFNKKVFENQMGDFWPPQSGETEHRSAKMYLFPALPGNTQADLQRRLYTSQSRVRVLKLAIYPLS